MVPLATETSPEEFKTVLACLEYLLANLLEQLPSSDSFFSRYSMFLLFTLDLDILEKTGDEIATLGEQLEGVFGWNARTSGDGIIPILERGKAICALHPILKEYHEKFPDNNVLKKWVLDVIADSNITWFNTPLCGNQEAQTLVDMIQVGQWYGKHEVWLDNIIYCFGKF